MATAPNDGITRTTGMAVQVTKFDVIHYCHNDLLLRAIPINVSGNPLSIKSTAKEFFPAHPI